MQTWQWAVLAAGVLLLLILLLAGRKKRRQPPTANQIREDRPTRDAYQAKMRNIIDSTPPRKRKRQ